MLIGIALATLVALAGRYAVPRYLSWHAAKSMSVSTAFDACVKRFAAEHPERFVHKGNEGISIYEIAGKVDATGAPIPCQFDVAADAGVSIEHDQHYSALVQRWSQE